MSTLNRLLLSGLLLLTSAAFLLVGCAASDRIKQPAAPSRLQLMATAGDFSMPVVIWRDTVTGCEFLVVHDINDAIAVCQIVPPKPEKE